MAVPTIVAQLITVIYNLADTYFVSSLGTNATAAVGVNSSLEQVINLGATLLAVGTGSYISRLLGAKKEEKANDIISTSVFTGILLSIVIMIIGFANTSGLVTLLGATSDCREYAIQYATYVLFAAPFMIISFILNQTLRSEGSATLSMVGMGFGGILNCFLDPLFIFHFGMGVKGASIATAISKFVSCVILLYPYIARRSMLKISVKHIHYVWVDVKEVISISASSFFRSLLQVLTATLMNRIAGHYSTSILAAVSVGNRVMRFPFAIVMGFSQGYQPVVGYNWGAKRYDRVRESLKFSLTVAVIGSLVMALVLIIFANPIIGIFTKADSELLRVGAMYMRFESATLVIHSVVAMVNMFYAGVGKPGQALLLSTARQGYCLIPVLYILPAIFGANGITACQATADVLTLIPAIPLTIGAFKLTNTKMREQMVEEIV
jgi:putative MATE family efflux protein